MDPVRSGLAAVASPWTRPTTVDLAPAEAPPAEAPTDTASVSPKATKASWPRRLLRAGAKVLAGVLLGITALGSIAYVGNREAIHTPIIAEQTIQAVPTSPRLAPPGGTTAGPAAPATTAVAPTVRPLPPGVVILLPGRTIQDLTAAIQSSPQFRSEMDAHVARVRTQIQNQLQSPPPIDHTELLDVRAPIPTGDRNFFHVGPVNLPSLGVPNLQSEWLPLVVRAHVDTGGARVKVDVVPVQERPSGPPGAIYLGSYRTTVWADQDRLDISGRVDVVTDLDGSATRPVLQYWQQRLADAPPGSPEAAGIQANIDRLQRRIESGARIQDAARNQGYDAILDGILKDQGVTFQRHVPLPRNVPLVQGTHHLWLGPDTDGDGRADLMVTEQLSTPGIDGLRLEGEDVTALAHTPFDGLLHLPVEQVRSIITQRVQDEVRAQLTGFSTQLPAEVRGHVHSGWRQGTDALQAAVRSQAEEYVRKFGSQQVQIPTPNVARPLDIRLDQVQAGDHGLAATIRLGSHPGGDVSRYLNSPNSLPVEMRGPGAVAILSGESVNGLLRGVDEGGLVDWQPVLDQLKRQHGLQHLDFNTGPDGRKLSPQIQWQNGRPVVVFEVTAVLGDEATGARTEPPAPAPAAGKASPAQAPLSLVDALAGGFKRLVGGTVDNVVSDMPGQTRNPVVSLRVTIPFELSVDDGVLVIQPQAEGLRLEMPQGTRSVRPAREALVASFLAQTVAMSDASRARLGAALGEHTVRVDLRDNGLRFAAATAQGQGTTADLFVRVVDIPLANIIAGQ